MNYILDSHAFIWFINGDNQLPTNLVKIIKDCNTSCFLSVASIWEITIKHSINRLELAGGFDNIQNFLIANDIQLLHLSFEHFQVLNTLDFHHKDPFDRIIISQGINEKITIITKDEDFKKYNVKTLWD